MQQTFFYPCNHTGEIVFDEYKVYEPDTGFFGEWQSEEDYILEYAAEREDLSVDDFHREFYSKMRHDSDNELSYYFNEGESILEFAIQDAMRQMALPRDAFVGQYVSAECRYAVMCCMNEVDDDWMRGPRYRNQHIPYMTTIFNVLRYIVNEENKSLYAWSEFVIEKSKNHIFDYEVNIGIGGISFRLPAAIIPNPSDSD